MLLEGLIFFFLNSYWSRTIFQELGKNPEEIWAKFEWEPIASASLAQVHVAYDSSGNKYAVKVQHEALKETSVSDMQAVTLMIHIVAYLFKDFSYICFVFS